MCNPRNGQGVAINGIEAVPDSSENGVVGNRDMAGASREGSGRALREARERQLVWNAQIGQDAVLGAPAHTVRRYFASPLAKGRGFR